MLPPSIKKQRVETLKDGIPNSKISEITLPDKYLCISNDRMILLSLNIK
jgi:hypothetical protein